MNVPVATSDLPMTVYKEAAIENLPLKRLILIFNELVRIKEDRDIPDLSTLAQRVQKISLETEPPSFSYLSKQLNDLFFAQHPQPRSMSVAELIGNAIETGIRRTIAEGLEGKYSSVNILYEKESQRVVIEDFGEGISPQQLITLLVPGKTSNKGVLFNEVSHLRGVSGKFGQGFLSIVGQMFPPCSNTSFCSPEENTYIFETSIIYNNEETKLQIQLKDETLSYRMMPIKEPNASIEIHTRSGKESLAIYMKPETGEPVIQVLPGIKSEQGTKITIQSPYLIDTNILEAVETFRFSKGTPIFFNNTQINNPEEWATLPFSGGTLLYPLSYDSANKRGNLFLCERGRKVMAFPLQHFPCLPIMAIDFENLNLKTDRSSVNFKNESTRQEVISIFTAVDQSALTPTLKALILNSLYPILMPKYFRLADEIREITDANNTFFPYFPQLEPILPPSKYAFLHPELIGTPSLQNFLKDTETIKLIPLHSPVEKLTLAIHRNIPYVFFDEALINNLEADHCLFNLTLIKKWIMEKLKKEKNPPPLFDPLCALKSIASASLVDAALENKDKLELSTTINEADKEGFDWENNFHQYLDQGILKDLLAQHEATQNGTLLSTNDSDWSIVKELQYVHEEELKELDPIHRLHYLKSIAKIFNIIGQGSEHLWTLISQEYDCFYEQFIRFLHRESKLDSTVDTLVKNLASLADAHERTRFFGIFIQNLECSDGIDEFNYYFTLFQKCRSIEKRYGIEGCSFQENLFARPNEEKPKISSDLYYIERCIQEIPTRELKEVFFRRQMIFENLDVLFSLINESQRKVFFRTTLTAHQQESFLLLFSHATYTTLSATIFKPSYSLSEIETLMNIYIKLSSIAQPLKLGTEFQNNIFETIRITGKLLLQFQEVILSELEKICDQLDSKSFFYSHVINLALYSVRNGEDLFKYIEEMVAKVRSGETTPLDYCPFSGNKHLSETNCPIGEYFLFKHEEYVYVPKILRRLNLIQDPKTHFLFSHLCSRESPFLPQKADSHTPEGEYIPLYEYSKSVQRRYSSPEDLRTDLHKAVEQNQEGVLFILRELIQNSFDANCKNIYVDLSKTPKGLKITFKDDGEGISERGWEAIVTPSLSTKNERRFGRGFLAILSQFHLVDITSTYICDGTKGISLAFDPKQCELSICKRNPSREQNTGTCIEMFKEYDSEEEAATEAMLFKTLMESLVSTVTKPVFINNLIASNRNEAPLARVALNFYQEGLKPIEVIGTQNDGGIYINLLKKGELPSYVFDLMPKKLLDVIRENNITFQIFSQDLPQNMNRSGFITDGSTLVQAQQLGVFSAAMQSLTQLLHKGESLHSLSRDFWEDFRYTKPLSAEGIKILELVFFRNKTLLNKTLDKLHIDLGKMLDNQVSAEKICKDFKLHLDTYHFHHNLSLLHQNLNSEQAIYQLLIAIPLENVSLAGIKEAFRKELIARELILEDGTYNNLFILNIEKDAANDLVEQAINTLRQKLDSQYAGILCNFQSEVISRLIQIREAEERQSIPAEKLDLVLELLETVMNAIWKEPITFEMKAYNLYSIACSFRGTNKIYINPKSERLKDFVIFLEEVQSCENPGMLIEKNFAAIANWLATIAHEMRHIKESKDLSVTHDKLFYDEMCKNLTHCITSSPDHLETIKKTLIRLTQKAKRHELDETDSPGKKRRRVESEIL